MKKEIFSKFKKFLSRFGETENPTVEEGREKYRFEGEKLELSEKEWKKRLSAEQYRILRKKGTERAFYNAFSANKEEGIYECAACGLPLYSSETKYDSGTGWPSFFAPLCKENLSLRVDKSGFTTRIEVVCSRCGGHLGHLFDDGPQPTGKRFCMNSGALKFTPK